jgi:ribosomal protein L11 methyltransferase
VTWHRRSLNARPELAEFLEERLLLAGHEHLSIERMTGDALATLNVYAEDPGELPGPEDLELWLAQAETAGLPLNSLSWQEERIADQDWDAAFRTHFARRRLSSRLEIIPSWERAGEGGRQTAPGPGAELALIVEPGQAFGTGEHPTTAACLARLETWMLEHGGGAPSCLDVGSGTGILSLAARLWGGGRVLGYDIDAACIVNSHCNADLNGLAGEVEFRWGEPEALGEGVWDLILCNLFMGPILRYLPRLDQALAPGGTVILSGFLPEQALRIREGAEARGWKLVCEETHGDWMLQEWIGA